MVVYERTDSTSSRAAELAGESDNDGLVILAREQTAGRGQHGRGWQCPAGSGVLMSVLLFPPPPLRRPAVLTAWAAVSVCETILQAANLQARIKWPNDVLLRGRKVCGILTESKWQASEGEAPAEPGCVSGAAGASPSRYLAVIVGIGLNVNQPPEAFTSPGLELGTSLRVSGETSFKCEEVARLLIHELDEEYARLCSGDLATLEACWKWRLGLLGRQVNAECADRTWQGRLREVAWDGVELEQADGEIILLQPELIRHLSSQEGHL